MGYVSFREGKLVSAFNSLTQNMSNLHEEGWASNIFSSPRKASASKLTSIVARNWLCS